MPAAAGARERGRARVLEGAAKGFRAHGFGGVGVDGIAKAAGVTSGAFYAHFRSKDAAFEATVDQGLQALVDAVVQVRATGADWAERFIDMYLGERRTCDLGESCALQSLTVEVARAGPEVRAAYEARFEAAVRVIADGLGWLPPTDRAPRARALLGLLAGGVSIARALASPAAAQAVADATRTAALALVARA